MLVLHLPRPLLVLFLLHGAVVARLGIVAQVVVDDPGRVLVDDLALAGPLIALVLPSAYGSGTVVLLLVLLMLLPVMLLMVVVLLVMEVVLVEGCRRVVAAEGGRRAGGAR